MPGTTIGKKLNPVTHVLWRGQITIQGKGNEPDYTIQGELPDDPQIAEMIRLQLKRLIASLTFKCRECLNGHEHRGGGQ